MSFTNLLIARSYLRPKRRLCHSRRRQQANTQVSKIQSENALLTNWFVINVSFVSDCAEGDNQWEISDAVYFALAVGSVLFVQSIMMCRARCDCHGCRSCRSVTISDAFKFEFDCSIRKRSCGLFLHSHRGRKQLSAKIYRCKMLALISNSIKIMGVQITAWLRSRWVRIVCFLIDRDDVQCLIMLM